MPRGKSGGMSKSAEIRALLEQDPKMRADEILQNLSGRGIKVSKNLIYLQKVKMKGRRRKLKRAAAMSAGRQAGIKDPVALILKLKSLAHEAGGMNHLKQLVDALAT
jgi:hypothetical protein